MMLAALMDENGRVRAAKEELSHSMNTKKRPDQLKRLAETVKNG